MATDDEAARLIAAAEARAAQKRAHEEAQTVGEPSNTQVLGVLHALGADVKDARGDIAYLRSFGQRNRRWIIITIAGLIFDLGLSGAFLYLNHRVAHASSSTVVNCRATVQVGKGFQDTFGPFLSADTPDNPATPQDEHVATIRFRNFINKLADRNCDKL